MSFYRTLLAALTAVVIATPVFAADEATTTSTDQQNATTSTTTTTSESSSTSAEQTKVNLNTATAKDLMKVKGLNAAKARAIIAYRKKNGDFKSLDDISNVKGFKKMKPEAVKTIQDQLSIN